MMTTMTTTTGLGFSTRVRVSGRGAPVLLLHGNPDNKDEWRHVMRELGDEVCCFAPDLPGFGDCDEPPASFDYGPEALRAFVDGVVDGLGIRERMVLVVHDIGGVVGVPWAARRLERVRGVVITNTVVFERFPWFSLARAWASTDVPGRLLADLRMKLLGVAGGALFRRVFGRLSPELSPEELERFVRSFALDNKSKRSTLRLFRRMVPRSFFDGVGADVDTMLARVPARVVWGTPDPFIKASWAECFPAERREFLDGAGHWVPISRPDRLAMAVRTVLAEDAR